MFYAHEKLSAAITTLVGPSTQRERLFNAFVYSVINIDPKRDLPEDLREDFIRLKESLTAVAATGDEGTARATIDTLTDSEISAAVDKILEMHNAVLRQTKY